MIEEALCNNDEITSTGLRNMLAVRYPELQVLILSQYQLSSMYRRKLGGFALDHAIANYWDP